MSAVRWLPAIDPDGGSRMHRPESGTVAAPWLRPATPADVPGILQVLDGYAVRGLVLPRTPEQVWRHLREFVVAADAAGRVAGCGALRLYSAELAEIGALAVAEAWCGRGVGCRLVGELVAEARRWGVGRVFALTLQEQFFHRQGFRTVPPEAVPEKRAADRAEGIDRSACPKITVVRDLA